MINYLLFGIVLIFPQSLENRQDEILTVAAEKQTQFLDQCYKWQQPLKCDKVIEKAKIRVVDDFIFPVRFAPHGTAHGRFQGVKRIKESLYNRHSTNNLEECQGSPIIRTREQMYKLSYWNEYWQNHPNDYFCADPSDLLASMVHELCHAFGREVGHVEGFEDCQSITK
jgi:hypothetical protein